MRTVFFTLCFVFCGQSSVLAQDQGCSSIMNDAQLRHLKALKQEAVNHIQRSEETTYIPIRFHAVADVDGEGRVRIENILDQLCAVNANFADQNIKFYMKDGMINEINDNTIYNNPASAAGTTKMATRKNSDGKNALNVFLTDQATTGGEGTTLGYYDFNADLVVLKKSVTQSSNQLRFVFGHEIGHFFSLPHTFRGWENAPWDGQEVTQFAPNNGILNEFVDGTNCEDAADLICDTPPDYNLGFGWDGCRDYDGGAKDPNGELLDPDESNFMGYFLGCEEYQFSEDQKEIMMLDYESPRRAYLRIPYVPNDVEITDSPSLLAPVDDSTTPFFNGVELTWTEVENATDYLVELSQGLRKSYHLSDGNKLFLTDLEEDKIYRWKVRAFSEISTCTDYSSVFSFRTGNASTSVTDLDHLEKQIQVSPNPIENNEINISFSPELSGDFHVKLQDATGRIYYSDSVNAFNFTISHLNLTGGFYFLSFSQGDTFISKKIIINE